MNRNIVMGEENGQIDAIIMTEAVIQRICEEQDLYHNPALNESLYLHYKGFREIENLGAYTQVRSLWLECNAISEIKNLDVLKNLQFLSLHHNLISNIENLDSCVNLVNLDLSHNRIAKIENLGNLTRLETLKVSNNIITKLEDAMGLVECKWLTNLDLSHNLIDVDRKSQSVDLLPEKAQEMSTTSKFPNSNIISTISTTEVPDGAPPETSQTDNDIDFMNSWDYPEKALLSLLIQLQQLIHNFHAEICTGIYSALPRLQYLDHSPVKPLDREVALAWFEGGPEAAKAKLLEASQKEKERLYGAVNNLRALQARHRENVKRALERIEREDRLRSANGNPTSRERMVAEAMEIERAAMIERRWKLGMNLNEDGNLNSNISTIEQSIELLTSFESSSAFSDVTQCPPDGEVATDAAAI